MLWSRTSRLFPALMLAAIAIPTPCHAQLEPARLYSGINRPLPCTLRLPTTDRPDDPDVELILFEADSEQIIERTTLPTAPHTPTTTPLKTLDLAEIFPIIWTARRPRILLVQMAIDTQPFGAPVVLEPLLTPRRFKDDLSQRVLDAFARRDAAELTRLLAISTDARRNMHAGVNEDPTEPILSGIRAYVLKDVMLETTEGPLRIELDPAAAPNTAFRFLQLAEGGFYDDMAFHRIINADSTGAPFLVQSGDPTGTGRGGSGSFADFEQSTLPHARGVLSMARRPDDPNTNDSQFFICLSREACAKLDGRYTSFARIVEGWDTLDAIAATPVAPPEEDSESVAQHPLRPPVIQRALSTPAPPIQLEDQTPEPQTDQTPVSR